MSSDSRLNRLGLLLALAGGGVTIIWPNNKWIGVAFLVGALVFLAYWVYEETYLPEEQQKEIQHKGEKSKISGDWIYAAITLAVVVASLWIAVPNLLNSQRIAEPPPHRLPPALIPNSEPPPHRLPPALIPNSEPPPEISKPESTIPEGRHSADWHDKQNWRKFLHLGMTREEVRGFFGEPTHIRVFFGIETWEYGDAGGEIQFAIGGKNGEGITSWSEPRQ
jgi:hypothetical protein